MNMVQFISLWMPVVLWASLIFYLSSIPSLNSGLGMWDFFLRKGAHVFEFFVFCGLLVRAMRNSWNNLDKKKLALWAGLISVFYAISDEYHQSFVPGRGPSFHDVLIDSVGVGLALFIFVLKIEP